MGLGSRLRNPKEGRVYHLTRTIATLVRLDIHTPLIGTIIGLMFHGLFRLGEKKATTFSNVFTTLSNILMHSHLMLSQC